LARRDPTTGATRVRDGGSARRSAGGVVPPTAQTGTGVTATGDPQTGPSGAAGGADAGERIPSAGAGGEAPAPPIVDAMGQTSTPARAAVTDLRHSAADAGAGGAGAAADTRGVTVRARLVALEEGAVLLDLGGVTHRFRHAAHGASHWLGRDGEAWRVVGHDPVEEALRGGAATAHAGELTAPMPGTVTVVKAAVGDEVTTGQGLLVVEAMKMEHLISAPHDGTVTELEVTPGSTVAMDQLLAVVTPHEPRQSEERE
ncbi:acetyl-CoA carboxylase biotin carboxyl carrier protein subunit, partial [Streptomyces javensis]|uniref:acetyl-CoA carboxylase biotin carboxyl carrier protein subunit n=1 Tax=Streptomyces javensis TaxID=114698 RepID=UPI003CD06305